MTDAPGAGRIDQAAFGVIYGAITILGVLAATDASYFDPLTTGLTLFTTVLAVALAKAYAEVASDALASGERTTWAMARAAWEHSRTTLLAANGPSLAMFGGAAGLYDAPTALALARILAMGLLLFYGWRIGWRLTSRVLPALGSASAAGGVGLAISFIKNLFY